MQPAAILLDLDGTLVDSERESAEAMARVLERDHGVRVTAAERDYVIGHSWNEIYARLREDHGEALCWSLTELIARSTAERAHVIEEVGLTILPGAREALRRLGRRWPLAIVTGSSRAEAAQALAVLGVGTGIGPVIASEDVRHGKPSPEGYLAAAARLGVAPAGCLVVEDSTAGVAAGRAAGMTVVAVRAGHYAGQDQSAAHHHVDTLDALTCAFIDALPAAGEARAARDAEGL